MRGAQRRQLHPKLWCCASKMTRAGLSIGWYALRVTSTFDRLWDTVLVLEGPLLDRKNGIARNHPLADFVQALPGLPSKNR